MNPCHVAKSRDGPKLVASTVLIWMRRNSGSAVWRECAAKLPEASCCADVHDLAPGHVRLFRRNQEFVILERIVPVTPRCAANGDANRQRDEAPSGTRASLLADAVPSQRLGTIVTWSGRPSLAGV